MQAQAAPGPDAGSTSDDLVPRRGSTSLAWKWLGFEKTDDQNNVICKICRKSIAVKQSSTTNLFHHRTNHSKEYREYEKLRDSAAQEKTSRPPVQHTLQQTLAESFSRKVPYDRKCQRWQDITNAITKFIAREMLLMQLMEAQSLIQLVNVLDA